MVGYKAVTGGASDPECTHVILTLSEYEELHQRIRTARNESSRAKEEANKAIAKAGEDAKREIRQIQTETLKDIEQLKKRLDSEQVDKKYQIGLNQRLLQISRERANADRKLKPKKERSGYVVLSSRQKKYRYKENRNNWGEVCLWETVIQTPYAVTFTAEQAITETQELFASDDNGVWLIGRLGITGEYDGKYEDMIDDPDCSDWKDNNIIVGKIFNANVKAGYWELLITHTKALISINFDHNEITTGIEPDTE